MVYPTSTAGCRHPRRRMGSWCGIQPCGHTKWVPRNRKLVLVPNVLGGPALKELSTEGEKLAPALCLPGSQEDKSQFPGAPMKTGLKLQAAGPLPPGTPGSLCKAVLGASRTTGWPVFTDLFTASPSMCAAILCHVRACFSSVFQKKQAHING